MNSSLENFVQQGALSLYTAVKPVYHVGCQHFEGTTLKIKSWFPTYRQFYTYQATELLQELLSLEQRFF